MIILIFSIFLFLSATFGYGRLFLRINRLDDLNLSFGETGILGLFFLTFIGLSLHFFFPLVQNLNFIIILVGILFLIYQIFSSQIKISLKYYKISLIIFLTSLIMFLGYNPNEDFGYYHLPYIVNLNSEKIIFGLSNLQLNQGWNSSWLLIKSIYNIKFIGINGVFVSNVIFYILISFVFLNYFYFNQFKSKSIFFFSFFFFIFLNLKFARLNSYGLDVPANFLAIYVFILFLFCLYNQNSQKKFFQYLEILILISLFSISFRVLNLIILILPLILILKYKIEFTKLIKSRIIIFSVLFFLIWQIQQIIYTGCFIIPNELTCFQNLSWFDQNIIENFKNDTSRVNKSFQTYSGNLNRNEYLSNFNWVSNWYDRNHVELFEHILTFLFPIIIFILFYKDKFTTDFEFAKQENNFYILLVTSIILIIWFIKAPVIRFATLYIQTLVLIIIILLLKNKFNKIITSKIIILFLLFALVGNFVKNTLRYKNNDILTIYPHIPKIEYSVSNHLDLKLNIPKKISGVDKSELCWNTPFLCRIGTFDGLDIKRVNNYLFILKK